MNANDSTRRAFLQRLSALGLAGLGAGTVLAGCGGGAEEAPELDTDDAVADNFSCTDTTGLTEAEVSMRETLNYVDDSPYEDRICANCQLYVAPEGGANCGGCTIIKGPVHPQGYCTSWVAKAP